MKGNRNRTRLVSTPEWRKKAERKAAKMVSVTSALQPVVLCVLAKSTALLEHIHTHRKSFIMMVF
jgi:hypothetical protein